MSGFFKYLILPALLVGLLANAKDIKRYLRMRNM
ncbi:DUF6893 family small protein [Paraburkholderia sp.]|jgi:hypothetical protein